MYMYMYIVYVYDIYTSKWYVRNYVRIVFQGGDHSKKVDHFRYRRHMYGANGVRKFKQQK